MKCKETNLKSIEKRIAGLVKNAKDRVPILEELKILEAQRNDALKVLDLIPTGVIIIDAELQPIIVNRYAQDVLKEKDGLSHVNCHITASHANTMRQLKTAIVEATTRHDAKSRVLSVRRPSGSQSLMVLVTPVREGSAAVFIADPERRPHVETGFIADLFGLTRMESAVAAYVAQGQRLNEVAETLNISLHTARSHLKHVFSKTGTDRQLELAHQIGALLGKVWLEDDQNGSKVVPLSPNTSSHKENPNQVA